MIDKFLNFLAFIRDFIAECLPECLAEIIETLIDGDDDDN